MLFSLTLTSVISEKIQKAATENTVQFIIVASPSKVLDPRNVTATEFNGKQYLMANTVIGGYKVTVIFKKECQDIQIIHLTREATIKEE